MKFPRGVLNHPINKKALKGMSKIQPAIMVSTWDFGIAYPQAERRLYGSHPCPAKMRSVLAAAILKIYGEEPILDPMCGSGTINIAASLMGLESYGLDIEERYVRVLEANLKKIPYPLKGRLGKAIIQKGDARAIPYPDNFFNFVFFSPPYWAAIQGDRGGQEVRGSKKVRRRTGYSGDPLNIGNILRYEDYLEEMFKVYCECLRVLEKSKLMVLVVKDINRDYLKIPVGADTIKICQKAGFKLYDININKMHYPAWWMVNYFTKQQEKGMMRALTTHEYVLVFQK